MTLFLQILFSTSSAFALCCFIKTNIFQLPNVFKHMKLEETQNRFLPPSWKMVSAYAQRHLSSHSSHTSFSLHLPIKLQIEQKQIVKNKTWNENTKLIVLTIKKQSSQLPFMVLKALNIIFFPPDVLYIFHLYTASISKKDKDLQFVFFSTYMKPHKVFGSDLIMNLVELFSFWSPIFKWVIQWI